MDSTEQFSVMLSNEVAVLSALDEWLKSRAVPAYEAYRADPSSGIALEDVRINLGKRGPEIGR